MECCLLQVIEAEEQLGGYDCVCFKGNMGGGLHVGKNKGM